jgi:hypothetical protein
MLPRGRWRSSQSCPSWVDTVSVWSTTRWRYYQNKGVPMLLKDDINPLNTLNQLGSVHWRWGMYL